MGAIVQNGLLTLGELRRAAGCLETVLLPFLHPRITREESGFLKCTAQLGVCNDKRTGDAMADRTGLTGVAAAVNIDVYVELESVSVSTIGARTIILRVS